MANFQGLLQSVEEEEFLARTTEELTLITLYKVVWT